jgi:HEAT repeat protein
MTPLALFVRTLLRTSAIFLGVTLVFLHPNLEWSARENVTAKQSPVEAAIDGLIGALEDSDAGVRRQAAAALGHVRAPRALPALVAALKDEEPRVRQRAALALGEIGDSRAVQALTEALKDPDPAVRRYAAQALSNVIAEP